jgi:hypothetical protein
MANLELTDGTATETVKTRDGGTQIVARGAGGMFQKRRDTTKEEASASALALLTETDAAGDSHLERILSRTIANAVMDPERDVLDKYGNVIGRSVDARIMMASAKASSVALKAAGIETPEKAVQTQHLVKIECSVPPEVLALILERQGYAMKEETLNRAPLQPSFIDAEIVEAAPHTPRAPVAIAAPSKKIQQVKILSVELLMTKNRTTLDKLSGVSMSSILKAANNESLQVRPDMTIVKGHHVVLAACCQGCPEVEAAVEEE